MKGIICCIGLTSWVTPHSFFFVPKRKQSVAMSKRSQESFSTDDSPTVKARSRTFNLVSQQCWSGKQSSSTSNSTIPGSTRTEGVSSSMGKPPSESTSKFSMLGSQVDGWWSCLPCTLQFRLCRCMHCSRRQNGHRGVFWSWTWHTQCRFRGVTHCFRRTTQIMFEAPLVCVVIVLFQNASVGTSVILLHRMSAGITQLRSLHFTSFFAWIWLIVILLRIGLKTPLREGTLSPPQQHVTEYATSRRPSGSRYRY